MLSKSLRLASLTYMSNVLSQQVPETSEPSVMEISPKEREIFANFTTWYGNVDTEITDHVLTGKTNWEIPEWLDGVFPSSGPSVQEFGGYEFDHYADGLGRFSSFRL